MTYLSTNKDFLLEVAKGKIAGHALVRRIGRNVDIENETEEDVWSGGGDINWQSSAQSLEVQCIAGAGPGTDDDEGDGARTIKIWGLNGSYAEANTVVSLDASEPVAVSGTWTSVDRVEILTTGDLETNAGEIRVQVAGEGDILAVMAPEYGQSYQASYVVPAGKTAYLIGWASSLSQAVSGSVELRLYTAEDGVGWRVQAIQELTQTGSGQGAYNSQDLLLTLPAKTRVRVRGRASASNIGVISSLTFVLVS